MLAVAALGGALPTAPSAATDSPPPEREAPPALHLDLGWTAGPTYELGYRLPDLGSPDGPDARRDVRVRGRVGASLSLDGGHLRGSAVDAGWEGAVRRARFLTRGELTA